MFISRISGILPIAVIIFISLIITPSLAQKEIPCSIFLDPGCSYVITDNLTLPAFDLTGKCFAVGPNSLISQCSTDNTGISTLNWQYWNTSSTCPSNVPVVAGILSKGKQGACLPFTLISDGKNQSYYGKFTCPTLETPLEIPPPKNIDQFINEYTSIFERANEEKMVPHLVQSPRTVPIGRGKVGGGIGGSLPRGLNRPIHRIRK